MTISTVSTPSLLMAASVVMRLAGELIAHTTDDDRIKGTTLEPFQMALQGCVAHLAQTAEGCRQLAVQMMLPEVIKAGFHTDLPQSMEGSPN